MPISWRGAPTLPTTDDKSKVVNFSYFSGSTAIPEGGSGCAYAAGSIAPSADIQQWRKQREEKIARGEDPEAAMKAREARKQEKKDRMKRMFGLKGESSKGESSKHAMPQEVDSWDSDDDEDLKKEKEQPNETFVRSTAGTFARVIGK